VAAVVAVADGIDGVRVVRSARAKRIRATVHRVSGEVTITLPQRAPLREADRALQQWAEWIAKRRAESRAVRARLAERGNQLTVWGEELALQVEPGRQRVARRGGELLIPAGPEGRDALERWLRAAARRELEPRAHAAAAALDRTIARLSVRDTSSRWGSCSARGALSFSWRLVLAPPWVAEAIIWHEACHLVELNHSSRFWSLLRSNEPRTDDARRWLKAHGATLVLPQTA